MANVFISYSRADKEFVDRLRDALEEKHKAWVDSDIPPTAEWQQEVLANIEQAANFVFVIRPRFGGFRPLQKRDRSRRSQPQADGPDPLPGRGG